MTGGRSKRRATTGTSAAGSGASETIPSPSLPSTGGLSMATPLVAPGVDLYTQARKALTERCPFDSDETVPRYGTLPLALSANLHKKSDGRRKHRKVQEDAAGKAVGPGRPPACLSMWEKTEAYFRPITLDDIDLLVTRLPPDSCFYIPGSENVLEQAVKVEAAVLDECPPGETDAVTSSKVVKAELGSVQVEAAPAMQSDGEVILSSALPLEEPEVEDKNSLNWILGCKQRFLLTSGRPSKKRKLLGEDAGLEQLLHLPRIEAAGAATPRCDFCCLGESDVKSNRLLLCDSCNVSVHQKCYGVHEVPAGGWLCSWCNYLEAAGRKSQRNADDEYASTSPCLLCPKASGALKPLAGNLEGSEETKFVHLFCCLWIPSMHVEDVGVMEPVMNVEGLQDARRRLVCYLCKVKHGTCVRCSHGTCRTSVHPVCARAANHQMEIWGKLGLDNVELRVFCSKHSSLQTIDSIAGTEHPSTIGKDDMVGKLLPGSIPIKRLPKIKITRRSKDSNVVLDEKTNSNSDEVKNDSNLDKENLVIKLRPDGGGAQSNKMEGFVAPDNGNVLQNTSDVIKNFRKVIDCRKISIADVALELGVSLASLESSMSDKPEGGDLKDVSDCSHRIVEDSPNFEAEIIELKTDNLERPDYDASLAGNLNNQDVVPCSRSFIHPFILKKLRELQNHWCLLHKQRSIKTSYNDRLKTTETKTVEGCPSIAANLDQLAKVKNMQFLDISPTDEIEGELLYLQNCLLDRVASIKHSCEELINRMINHLSQELDAFRRKRWDMVLVNQYICEVKEAKKKGRKERRHKEAQAILAAATAAAASSRNSMLRKDAFDGVSSSQQNPLYGNTATRRATTYSPPVPRPKETISRSSVTKVSSDKHSGDLKFPDFAKENILFCDVCWRTETIVNRIFVCSSCKVAVHLDCYRRLKDPAGPWRCEFCEVTSLQASPGNQQLGSSEKTCSRAQCSLCSGVTGAFRKSTNGEWVHAFCAEWLLESTYKRGQQNLVGGMDAISKEKDINTCCICHNRLGLCLKCSYGHCQAKFHPTCARSAGLFMNIKAIGGRFQHKAYCEKHSVEQREKVDSQHGAEELKNIKQVRVDLEKVRLLCERIIRREKLKRDLVVCSHGILASRRDCVAFSAMVRSSFALGISSESATTSIDNPSCSGTFQRRDDMTVDSSTIHGRQSCRLLMDVDRRTDDSSTSQLSNKRKIADRIVFAGKKLPQRPTSRVSNAADGGETRSKDRKDIKSLPKEKVMTSYQASLQNLRLPKGFVYVPVGSLQKDGSAAHDSESCERQEPGG
ncbi:hypothetical protein IEQ34_015301 [Dendrobium chrysotoxum]|uniref:Uncharacterized protein n=1 Tax=Dendrobium chrysotoxum TaxID=161865 RepID=A0AAV7GI10_DENCH|nr:hypothetical protein IEQ34_015301 [Dendrobium chrysotoxum]